MPEDVKKRRNNELLAVQHEVSKEVNAEMIGEVVELMVEGESKHAAKAAYPASNVTLGRGFERRFEPETTQLVGRTRGDQIVCFEGEASLAGSLVDVEITGSRGLTLFGRRAGAAVLA